MGERSRSILIVDDDPDILDSLASVFSDEGYAVAVAKNGREALDYLHDPHNRRPDLILLDLMMPVMSGWEFRAVQREDQDLSAIPVIVLSGDERVEEKARELQVACGLPKPIGIDGLLDAVQRYS